MSPTGRSWRFLAASERRYSLVRRGIARIRKPLFSPLNYGDVFGLRFSIADWRLQFRTCLVTPSKLLQRRKLAGFPKKAHASSLRQGVETGVIKNVDGGARRAVAPDALSMVISRSPSPIAII